MEIGVQECCLRNCAVPTVVAGLGSPFGDDQVGWRLVEMLQRRPHVRARVKKIQEATQLLDELEGCTRLIIVDGCRSGGRLATVTRLQWPDTRIAIRHSNSTHGISLCQALLLAEHVGRLRAAVEIFGIEIAECNPGREMCPEVLGAVVELEAELAAALCEASYA